MKPVLKKLLFMCILFISAPSLGLSEDTIQISQAGDKLSMGIANITTGFVEIPKSIIVTSRKNGITYGLTAGFMTGILNTIGRTLSGTLDVATFVIPTEALVSPEYIWGRFDQETSFNTNWEIRR